MNHIHLFVSYELDKGIENVFNSFSFEIVRHNH